MGVLNEVKCFITDLLDKTPFVGNLIFQGSDDGVAFTDLWNIDESVHEGWNNHDFVSDKPLTLADIYNIDSDEVRITKEKKQIGFQ